MIEPKQRVRVANKLGKMIRLIAKSSFELDWSTLGLQLVEKVDDTWVESDAKESFNIHSRKSQKLANPTVRVHLPKTHKRLCGLTKCGLSFPPTRLVRPCTYVN
jgi:hypothetical protein